MSAFGYEEASNNDKNSDSDRGDDDDDYKELWFLDISTVILLL